MRFIPARKCQRISKAASALKIRRGPGENREVDIYMNNPLRYEGQTFYQYQMNQLEMSGEREESVLQVVRNPGWLTPYLGCLMVGLGMAYSVSVSSDRLYSKKEELHEEMAAMDSRRGICRRGWRARCAFRPTRFGITMHSAGCR